MVQGTWNVTGGDCEGGDTCAITQTGCGLAFMCTSGLRATGGVATGGWNLAGTTALGTSISCQGTLAGAAFSGTCVTTTGTCMVSGTYPSTGGTGPTGAMFQGKTYVLTSAAEDWLSAEAEAVSKGGHLAAVTSQAEQDFLTATFCSAATPFWIGGSNVNGTGQYQWTTGDPFVFTAWSPGEPNNSGGVEHYTAMNWHFAEGNGPAGLWNDAPEPGTTGYPGTTDGPYFGIIEIP
jgi:hypothetical protein